MNIEFTKFNLKLVGSIDLENKDLTIELQKNSERISMWVMRTREELIRQGLIKLGWTPPLREPITRHHHPTFTEMNEEQQRILIAEACGWRCNSDSGWYPPNLHPANNIIGHVLPDYLHDLNAMHEAEETLDASQCAELARQLKEHHPTYCLTENEQEGEERDYQDFILCHATASQRAEAFLRVTGKWRDEA